MGTAELPEPEPSEEEFTQWLRDDVATEIDELQASPLLDPGPADAENHAFLTWFIKYAVRADPRAVQITDETLVADGNGDGGIDLFVQQSQEGETTFDIYQISRPSIDKVRRGKRSSRPQKLSDDIQRFRNTLTTRRIRASRLNSVATEAVVTINRSLELAAEDPARRVYVNIWPVTLNHISAPDIETIRALQKEAAEKWSSNEQIRWRIHNPVTAGALLREHQRQVRQQNLPSRIRLRFADRIARASKDKGPYLGFVRAAELITAYETYGAKLLDSNLRYALGKTKVNALITQELSSPTGIKNFHIKNNGLVIACTRCEVHEHQNELLLHDPQVINGGQTIDTLACNVRELHVIPPEQRDEVERQRAHAFSDLLVSVRIIELKDRKQADNIAMASNTQNELSPRTMMSAQLEMTRLRYGMAELAPFPWYCETKDGEWEAVKADKPYLQSRTKNRLEKDFSVRGTRLVRRVSNLDLGIALLSFYGFVDKAKSSFVFDADNFRYIFAHRLKNTSWKTLAEGRMEWRSDRYREAFEPEMPGASVFLLGYLCWRFWKRWTFPESVQLLFAYEEEGRRRANFLQYKKGADWDVPDDQKAKLLQGSDTCYWVEQVAKSAYLVLVHETMRVLVRRYGHLDAGTCGKILALDEVARLAEGQAPESLGDFRGRAVGSGVLTTIARMLHYACRRLWESEEVKIRNMASRQQGLLLETWVQRLSQHTDAICEEIGRYSWRQAVGLDPKGEVGKEVDSLEKLLPAIE